LRSRHRKPGVAEYQPQVGLLAALRQRVGVGDEFTRLPYPAQAVVDENLCGQVLAATGVAHGGVEYGKCVVAPDDACQVNGGTRGGYAPDAQYLGWLGHRKHAAMGSLL
jgi:hypothetical protein